MANHTSQFAVVLEAGTFFLPSSTSPILHGEVGVAVWDIIRLVFTWNNIWKLSTFTLILLNLKALPFIYHLRILNALRFVLRSQRPNKEVGPEQLFQPLITSSKACLMEIDVFGHKSNSTYFADVDVARVHLITTLFGRGIDKIRGGTTMNGLSGKPRSNFTVALGAVSCCFKRELLPYETYDMWTKVLSWDEKWFYLVTHFVKKGSKIQPGKSSLYPQQDRVMVKKEGVNDKIHALEGKSKGPAKETTSAAARSPIAASALSKIVFKDGRVTISPLRILEASGLLPSSHPGGAEGTMEPQNAPKWKLLKEIEAERLRGLDIANLLAKQTVLENEFASDVALGRHYDGVGIEGVVATLGQLGKISPYQLI
ncbi:hypothetical protein PV08_08447 [Exophiala spinifera]|uniref:Thioesterase domain-containing protein n=1 Tax=Exophiala spinifera TaxID=91928 RepID=A0A0D2B3L6_9EURO|nr:uncharacterized protein PV08_08447 [Exophiala spinifera]KIW13260.1 hypothetical protein PV08_08447 [Exophiala spinifera]